MDANVIKLPCEYIIKAMKSNTQCFEMIKITVKASEVIHRQYCQRLGKHSYHDQCGERLIAFHRTDDSGSVYCNVYDISLTPFALAVISTIRLFNTSVFHMPILLRKLVKF